MRANMTVVVVALLCGMASAEIPTMISYQGKVTDASGNPVADNSYTMRFRIYNQLVGGTLRWDSDNQTVSVAGGVFSVALGGAGQPALDLLFDEDYWLLVTFDGVNQTPRQRLTSAGYAYMASGLVAGTTVSGTVTSEPWATLRVINTGTTNDVVGVLGQSACPGGGGVYGYGTATTGETYGVFGLSMSNSGRGVYGLVLASYGAARGVYGESAADRGVGVYGEATATSGFLTYGVYGTSASTLGRGVLGGATATSGNACGVYGQTASTGGKGVWGLATATEGVSAMGVLGTSDSSAGTGVYGSVTATEGPNRGVIGQCSSTEGIGVLGMASANSGPAVGVRGTTNSPYGTGVHGEVTVDVGSAVGVWGVNDSPLGYGVYSSGNFAVSGSKSCVVKTSKGPTLMYCQESPENWFEDFGEGQLVNGRCHIELDPLFLETVTVDAANPMKVFVQLGGDCRGVFVERSLTGFDVLELQGGMSSVPFTYRVVAKRKGFEEKRLDYCAAAERDSYLYPELREQERRELEAERARYSEERARMEEERRLENVREGMPQEDAQASIR